MTYQNISNIYLRLIVTASGLFDGATVWLKTTSMVYTEYSLMTDIVSTFYVSSRMLRPNETDTETWDSSDFCLLHAVYSLFWVCIQLIKRGASSSAYLQLTVNRESEETNNNPDLLYTVLYCTAVLLYCTALYWPGQYPPRSWPCAHWAGPRSRSPATGCQTSAGRSPSDKIIIIIIINYYHYHYLLLLLSPGRGPC